MGFFHGGIFDCVASLYVGRFSSGIRGLLAGVVQLVYNGGDAKLSWFGPHYGASDCQVVQQIGGAGALCAAAMAWIIMPDDRAARSPKGRRAGTIGFRLSAACIVMYVNVQPSPVLCAMSSFCYGFCLVRGGVWGLYFVELCPEHLRAIAASIFNWGRIVSQFGALMASAIAKRFRLLPIRYAGALPFAAAAALCGSLPENLHRREASLLRPG